MGSFEFWRKWLFTVGVLIAVIGAVIAFFSGTSLFSAFNGQVYQAFWQGREVPNEAMAFGRWLFAIVGAVMAGWGVTISFIARYPFKERQKWAWDAIALALLLWFAIDTFYSLYFNVLINAALNTLFIALVAAPLVFTRGYFKESNLQA